MKSAKDVDTVQNPIGFRAGPHFSSRSVASRELVGSSFGVGIDRFHLQRRKKRMSQQLGTAVIKASASVGLALVMVGCSSETPSSPTELKPSLTVGVLGDLTLCKVGTDATFDVTSNGVTTQVDVADGECKIVFSSHLGNGTATIQEIVDPDSQVLDSIVDTRIGQSGAVSPTLITGTDEVTVTVNGDTQHEVTFYNSPVTPPETSQPGRMTGGGKQIDANGVAITRGFTIHCDIKLSNNLEINWPGHKWHISKPLTAATCINDPNYKQPPPKAPFNTFIGDGVGKLDGVAGSTVHFTFIDNGEPGKNDLAAIQIKDAGGNIVLDVPLRKLDHGNIQAHYDQPHGNKPSKP
jgi:hypothetical protein